jgi:hypothetical protein
MLAKNRSSNQEIETGAHKIDHECIINWQLSMSLTLM